MLHRQLPQWLGYGGLIPFIVLALGAAFGPGDWRESLLPALVAYGALILSFLGGITWGLALLARDSDRPLYLVSMAPFFLAWLSLLLPTWAGIWVLALAFLITLYNDLAVVRRDLAPAWFRTLRTVLTAGVVASLLLAALAS
jgi:hypothetical protein